MFEDMRTCKNRECRNGVEGKNLYCSVKCRSQEGWFVRKDKQHVVPVKVRSVSDIIGQINNVFK